MSVSPIPAGHHTLTPYLIVNDGEAALEFYAKAFGAEERRRMLSPDGAKVMHAEIKIGDSVIMLADEFLEMGMVSPRTLGGSGTFLHLYVEDVDWRFAQAVEAGAQMVHPVEDQFYGDRSGTLKDPFDHVWTIGTRMEDLTDEQIEERFKAWMKERE